MASEKAIPSVVMAQEIRQTLACLHGLSQVMVRAAETLTEELKSLIDQSEFLELSSEAQAS